MESDNEDIYYIYIHIYIYIYIYILGPASACLLRAVC